MTGRSARGSVGEERLQRGGHVKNVGVLQPIVLHLPVGLLGGLVEGGEQFVDEFEDFQDYRRPAACWSVRRRVMVRTHSRW